MVCVLQASAVNDKHAVDGRPIKTLIYDWEMTSLELLGMIQDLVHEDHPELLARSFTFLVSHAAGSLMMLKHQPSNEVGILGGVWKNGKQIDKEGGSHRIIECEVRICAMRSARGNITIAKSAMLTCFCVWCANAVGALCVWCANAVGA